MEAAVKVQSMASMKTRATDRMTSQDVSVKDGNFTQLLQMKKDLAKDTEPAKTDGAESGKPTKKPDTKPAGDKKEDSQGQTEEVRDSQDPGQQEALEKAALQLAAAQMMVNVSEEPVAEMPEVTEAVAGVEAETQQAAEVLTEDAWAVQEQPEKAEGLVREDVTVPTAEKAEKPAEAKPEENPQEIRAVKPEAETPKAEVRPETGKQESRTDTSDTGNRQVQESDGNGQQMAGAGTFRVSGQTEPLFRETGRTEALPLKTTPDTLPQDLGRTLASRMPEAGRTLTVELEPASLGKLTIRMTYEAGRAAVSILATNPRTLELLSEKATEIASILEEKTGQETVILTQQPHEQEEYQENKHGGNAQGDQEQREQGREEKHPQSDSFAQQLRLGLV